MANDVSTLNPQLRQLWEYAAWIYKQITGSSPTLTSAFRSTDEQRALLNSNNPYPVNQPGDSSHNVKASDLGKGALGFDSWVPDKIITLPGGYGSINSRDLWTAIRQYVGLRVPDNDVVHSEIPNWRNYHPRF